MTICYRASPREQPSFVHAPLGEVELFLLLFRWSTSRVRFPTRAAGFRSGSSGKSLLTASRTRQISCKM